MSISAAQLRRELRHNNGAFLANRRTAATLTVVGITSLAIVALYQLGIFKRLPEPALPGLDAEKVNGSSEAYKLLDLPDAVLGLGATPQLSALRRWVAPTALKPTPGSRSRSPQKPAWMRFKPRCSRVNHGSISGPSACIAWPSLSLVSSRFRPCFRRPVRPGANSMAVCRCNTSMNPSDHPGIMPHGDGHYRSRRGMTFPENCRPN